jgi:hypothetical protein
MGFTNNVAERQVRPVKVQQRSSGGCWRTLQGLAAFAVVQSYLSTAAHWDITRFQALHRLFNGDGPWIPPKSLVMTAVSQPAPTLQWRRPLDPHHPHTASGHNLTLDQQVPQ